MARSVPPYHRTVSACQGGLGVLQALGQGRLARPLLAGATDGARRAVWGGVVQGRIQPQPGDDHHRVAEPRTGGQQRQRRVGTVGHRHHGPVRQPAPQLAQHLAAPVREGLMALPALLMVARRRRQHGEERQGPHLLGPRHAGQQLQRHPAQATRLHEVPLTGAHRITVEAFGGDLRPPPAFDRVIQPHEHRCPGRPEGADQQPQQDATQRAAGPTRAVEHPMIVHKGPVILQAQHAQRGGDRAGAGRQDRADEQRLGPRPHPAAEPWFEGTQHADDLRGQVTHGSPFLGSGV